MCIAMKIIACCISMAAPIWLSAQDSITLSRGKLLFNGKNLKGWHQVGGQARFEVRDRCITGIALHSQNTFLVTKRSYDDFVLTLECRIDTSLNSGIQIRSHSLPHVHNGRFQGYQVEIDPTSRGWSGGIYNEGTGWVQHPADEQRVFLRRDWNQVRIEAIADHIRTWINGIPVADYKNDMTMEGYIGLQVHGVPEHLYGIEVQWKNIRIQKIRRPHHSVNRNIDIP